MLITVGVVSAVAWGLAMNYGSPVVINLAKIKEVIHFGGKPVFEKPKLPAQAPDQIASVPEVSYTPEPQRPTAQEHLPATEVTATQQSRQTVFNDRNYTPKGAANVTTFERPVEQPKIEGGVKVAIIKEAPRLRDNCPFKEGSIEQRECRKKADYMERNSNYTGNRSQ